MQTEAHLHRLLAKVRALRARAATPGERRAAAEAEERLLVRLRGVQREEAVMHRFSIGDPWSRKLFFTLLDREGFEALRYPRQHRHTIRVRAPRDAMDSVWREFRGLQAALLRDLEEVAGRHVRTAAFASP